MRLKENIIIQWFLWQFFDVPKEILASWKNFLLFNLNYFSIISLFKTFFSPWRRYSVSYGKKLDIGRYLEAFFSNLIFRILGMIMRFFLITFGLLLEIIIFSVGLGAFLGWLVLTLILIAGLIFGFRIIV